MQNIIRFILHFEALKNSRAFKTASSYVNQKSAFVKVSV